MRVGVVITLFLLNACIGPLQIGGPYASGLSESNIQQIKLAVSAYPDIDHGIRNIDAIGPNKVRVETGHIDSFGGWIGTGLFLVKRSGKWFVDKNALPEATLERTFHD